MNIIRSTLASGLTAVAIVASAPAAFAAATDELDQLYSLLGVEELLGIMRDEGLHEAEDLRNEMFPGRGGAGWDGLVDSIYNVESMSDDFRAAFDAGLGATDVTPLLEFFGSDRGRRIVSLELEGRRALGEEGIEEAARDAFDDLRETDAERVELYQRFITVNDLIEYNVMGGMNSSLAFMRGMAEGEGVDMAEADIMADIWTREDEIRADTTEWLYAYLTLAYQPLEAEDVSAYLSLSESEEGRALNRALFAGFDEVFTDVSYSLGAVVSRFMVGEDL